MEDRDGYRMKFACYYPRVEYGQCPSASILLGISSWGLPAPPPPPPVSSLLCSDCLPLSCPSQASRLRFSEKMAELLSVSLRPRSSKPCILVGRTSGRAGGLGSVGAEVWVWGLLELGKLKVPWALGTWACS